MKINFQRYILVAAGIAINIILSYIMTKNGLPFFLDTAGTIIVSAVSGVLFSGIFTAVISSVFCSFFSEGAIYFSFFNALIAIFTVWFVNKYSFKNFEKTVIFSFLLVFICSLTDAVIQNVLFGAEQNTLIAQNAFEFSRDSKIPYDIAFFIVDFLLSTMDKGLSFIFVILLLSLIPDEKIQSFKNGIWKQKALSESDLKSIKDWCRDIKTTLRKRSTLTLIITSVMLVFVMGWIGIKLYYDYTKDANTDTAKKTLIFAADFIDTDLVNEFIKYGEDLPEYNETYDFLHRIWKTSSEIQYLYVVRIEDQGCRFIFDINDGDDSLPNYAGKLIPFDSEFEKYLPDLFAGNEIEPVENKTLFGWMESLYYPVKNSTGRTVCYICADISLDNTAEYMGKFLLHVFLIMAGFFILIIAYALLTTGVYSTYPISTIAACVDRFAHNEEEQEKLDENVRKIRSLDIHTGDEVEKLYLAICRMTLNQAEQIRNVRRLSDSTAKMQDGLIITMADMVESRDSDTGAHVQKTAAYVKIIVEGLKKKGYYPQKITPKFMSDVVRSAPLHDVGKINIPDGVLNKPGKLTDEEFAIMKTHTTAGKKILENAISTVQGENYLKEARNMAAYHHERWDGKGYPEGLHGEVIPLSARIMAVADVFDALASPRVYKPAFPLEKALAILQEGAGSQFDPKCVEVFMDSLADVKLILKKYSTPV